MSWGNQGNDVSDHEWQPLLSLNMNVMELLMIDEYSPKKPIISNDLTKMFGKCKLLLFISLQLIGL